MVKIYISNGIDSNYSQYLDKILPMQEIEKALFSMSLIKILATMGLQWNSIKTTHQGRFLLAYSWRLLKMDHWALLLMVV